MSSYNAPASPARPRRVLVVEDSPNVAASLRALLELFGFESRVAPSGDEGLRAVRAWRPDAVVTDIGRAGFDLARELKRAPATANTFLVGLTDSANEEARRRASASGFDRLLIKGEDPAALTHLLEAIDEMER